MTQLTRHLAVSGAQSCYCFSFRLFQDTIQDLLSVANFGRFEVEDYGGVVEVESEHLAHEVSDDLVQSLPVQIFPCFDASTCCYRSRLALSLGCL